MLLELRIRKAELIRTVIETEKAQNTQLGAEHGERALGSYRIILPSLAADLHKEWPELLKG